MTDLSPDEQELSRAFDGVHAPGGVARYPQRDGSTSGGQPGRSPFPRGPVVGLLTVALVAGSVIAAFGLRSHHVTGPAGTPGTPSARTGAALAYDPETKTVILFGGADSDIKDLGDTWSFDGTAWTKLSPGASPPARSGAALSRDPVSGHLILFGGVQLPAAPSPSPVPCPSFSPVPPMPPAPAPPVALPPVAPAPPIAPVPPGTSSPTPAATKTSPPVSGGGGGGSGSADGTSVKDLPYCIAPSPVEQLTWLSDTWSFDGSTWTQLHPATTPDGTGPIAGSDTTTNQLVLIEDAAISPTAGSGGGATGSTGGGISSGGVTSTSNSGTLATGAPASGSATSASSNAIACPVPAPAAAVAPASPRPTGIDRGGPQTWVCPQPCSTSGCGGCTPCQCGVPDQSGLSCPGATPILTWVWTGSNWKQQANAGGPAGGFPQSRAATDSSGHLTLAAFDPGAGFGCALGGPEKVTQPGVVNSSAPYPCPLPPSPMNGASTSSGSGSGGASTGSAGPVFPRSADQATFWRWSGSAWTKVGQSGDAPLITLSGGISTALLGMRGDYSTWAGDGATWKQVAPQSPTGPRPGSGDSSVYDPATKTVVLVISAHSPPVAIANGTGAANVPSKSVADAAGGAFETWQWDGTTWTRLGGNPTPAPSPSLPTVCGSSLPIPVGTPGVQPPTTPGSLPDQGPPATGPAATTPVTTALAIPSPTPSAQASGGGASGLAAPDCAPPPPSPPATSPIPSAVRPSSAFRLQFSGAMAGTATSALPNGYTGCGASLQELALNLPNGDVGTLSIRHFHVGTQPLGSRSSEASAILEDNGAALNVGPVKVYYTNDNPSPSGTVTVDPGAASGAVNARLYASDNAEVTISGTYAC